MESLIKEHIKKFNKEPYIIGMFWSTPGEVEKNILKAIKDNKPYNEYDLLSKDEQKAYDNDKLVF